MLNPDRVSDSEYVRRLEDVERCAKALVTGTGAASYDLANGQLWRDLIAALGTTHSGRPGEPS